MMAKFQEYRERKEKEYQESYDRRIALRYPTVCLQKSGFAWVCHRLGPRNVVQIVGTETSGRIRARKFVKRSLPLIQANICQFQLFSFKCFSAVHFEFFFIQCVTGGG